MMKCKVIFEDKFKVLFFIKKKRKKKLFYHIFALYISI